MAFYRINKQDKFTQIDNRMIQDNTITAKAKGILLYLLSKPNDWKVYESDIVNNMKDGRDGIRSGVKELIEQGYITRHLEQDEKGKFSGYSYNVYEYKTDNPEYGKTDSGKPVVGKPVVGKPENGKTENGKPDTTNTHLSNTGLTKTKDNNIKDNGILENADTPVKQKPVDKYKEQVHEVIKYLNEKANKSFRLDTKAHHGFIKGRLKDGYTIDDLKRVIDIKTSQWLNDDRMNEFLRPKTLFNATNFDGYVNEQPKKAFKGRVNDYDLKNQQSNTEPPKTAENGDMIFTAMYEYAFDETTSKRDAKIKFEDVSKILKFKKMDIEGYKNVQPITVNGIQLSMLCSVVAEFLKNEFTSNGNKNSNLYDELLDEYIAVHYV